MILNYLVYDYDDNKVISRHVKLSEARKSAKNHARKKDKVVHIAEFIQGIIPT